MKKSALSISLLVAFSIVTFGLSTAKADSLNMVTNSASFNDTATWPGGCATSLASITTTSTNGVTVSAADDTNGSGGIAEDIQKAPGCSYGGWGGNFAPGATLIYSANDFGAGASGPITLTFSSPVSGVGTQFQAEDFGTFTAVLSLYDGNTLLDTFDENGLSNGNADNSAIFLGGIDSSGADITSAVLSVTNTASGRDDFAANQISLVETPEPTSILLLAVGLAALLGFGLRYKQRTQLA